jgi:hypothetical protein
MICEHIKESTKQYNICGLGMYGGKPSHGTCRLCVEKGQNNAEYAAELAARAERSHPSGAKRVSGCCDSARNYIDR